MSVSNSRKKIHLNCSNYVNRVVRITKKKFYKNVYLLVFYFILSLYAVFIAYPLHAEITSTTVNDTKSKPLQTLETTERVLSDYREKKGRFSNTWAVYSYSEKKDESLEWFIEVNKKKLGPFDNFSELIMFSQDGKKVVFAAREKQAKLWNIYVNGEKKWQHEGLAWTRFTWPSSLEGNIINSQTQAVGFTFSTDGKLVSYLVSKKQNGKTAWAVAVNGKVGKYYKDASTNIKFLNGKIAYLAWLENQKKVYVIGDTEYGPYDTIFGIRFSKNGQHFSFVGGLNDTVLLIVDGKENRIPGKHESHALANDGRYVLAYNVDGKVHVIQNGKTWPTSYTQTVWHQLKMTADGKTVAGWFKRDNKWFVLVNGTTEYGPYDSYYYISAGDHYSLFLGKNGANVGYYTRIIDGDSTGSEFYLNGKKRDNKPIFDGLSISYAQDESGQIVGSGKMGRYDADTKAVADAAAAGAANPINAKYYGERLIYSRKKSGSTYVVEGDKEFGPYNNASFFTSSASGEHYAFIVKTKLGTKIVIDGKYQTANYQSAYKLKFNSENEIAFLTVKEKKVVRVAMNIPGAKPWWKIW